MSSFFSRLYGFLCSAKLTNPLTHTDIVYFYLLEISRTISKFIYFFLEKMEPITNFICNSSVQTILFYHLSRNGRKTKNFPILFFLLRLPFEYSFGCPVALHVGNVLGWSFLFLSFFVFFLNCSYENTLHCYTP